jgi:GT2 family glycosyltransferase
MFVPSIRVVHLRGASSTQKAYVSYITRQLRAKLQFVQDHFGTKHACYYKILSKMVLFQRFLFYSFAARIIPSSEFELRKQQSKLSYIAACNMVRP